MGRFGSRAAESRDQRVLPRLRCGDPRGPGHDREHVAVQRESVGPQQAGHGRSFFLSHDRRDRRGYFFAISPFPPSNLDGVETSSVGQEVGIQLRNLAMVGLARGFSLLGRDPFDIEEAAPNGWAPEALSWAVDALSANWKRAPSREAEARTVQFFLSVRGNQSSFTTARGETAWTEPLLSRAGAGPAFAALAESEYATR